MEVSQASTWTFNILTIANDLIFAFVLHKISKRLPIPFQYENKDDQTDVDNPANSPNLKGALSLRPLNEPDLNIKPVSEQIIIYNIHENKYINCCCKCNYKLIEPTYPSYYFKDITPDRRKELLEDHWRVLQDTDQSQGDIMSSV